MAVYLGFSAQEYEVSLHEVRAAVEAKMSVRQYRATPAISVEEQVEARAAQMRRMAAGEPVTSTSTMTPVESLRPIPAQPKHVGTYGWGQIVRVRFGSVTSSVASLVDDGDWNYHYEWSEWSPV